MTALLRAVRQNRLLAIGSAIVLALVAVGLLAPWIAPYDPHAIVGDSFEHPSWEHLLGTNDAGADNFSRLVLGSRTTLIVVGGATALILVIGMTVGLVAGLRGGLVETVLMRVVDVFLSLPVLPLLILIAAVAGPSRGLSILMIAVFMWPQTARIVRSQTMTLRSRGFVQIARGLGAGPLHVMRRHLAPALGPVVAANLVYMAGQAVIIESGLSFLGLGDPTAVSWGGELSRSLGTAQSYIGWLWVWWMLPAGLAITLAMVGITFIGLGLEPEFNPRSARPAPA
ncbi:MAG TPA: ABC transporter permease [Acidimicrobiales bacterium]|nr:ABC transporter permease [Acidimicrobiales bacterium]